MTMARILPSDGASLTLRQPPFVACVVDGQICDDVGAPSSWMSVASCGFAEVTEFSTDAVWQDSTIRPRRIGPCASWVENSESPAWLTHACQNRKPSSCLPGGL